MNPPLKKKPNPGPKYHMPDDLDALLEKIRAYHGLGSKNATLRYLVNQEYRDVVGPRMAAQAPKANGEGK